MVKEKSTTLAADDSVAHVFVRELGNSYAIS